MQAFKVWFALALLVVMGVGVVAGFIGWVAGLL